MAFSVQPAPVWSAFARGEASGGSAPSGNIGACTDATNASGLHWKSAHSDAVWLDNHHGARFKVSLDRCDVCQQHREEGGSATIRQAAKEDEGRAGRFPKREQRPEIRIFRHQHAIFFRGEPEDRGIVRGLQAELADMYRVMASRAEAFREPWRQRVVDEELQTEATSGSCRSSTAAAA